MTGRPGDWSRRSCTGSAGRTRRRRPRAACSNSRCRGFGFSSRRRHTRLTCDWSSEVCSSDLRLTRRGIEIRMETSLESAEGGIMRLSSGEEFAATTLVWTTGVRPHALAARSGFPVDERGRVTCDEYLRVHNPDGGVVTDAWAAGDNAAVPDLTTGGWCPPTAQHAIRQAKQLARNVVAVTRGR